MSFKKLTRTCYWCSQKLMAVSHVEIQGPDGIVWTHKTCELDTREHFRKITAQPKAHWNVGITEE